MPIYEYIHDDGVCVKGENKFEIMQSIKDDELKECPKCNKPVKRIISIPSKAGGVNILTPGNIAEKGFLQYTKRDDGVYEKTAGQGADFITDNHRKITDD